MSVLIDNLHIAIRELSYRTHGERSQLRIAMSDAVWRAFEREIFELSPSIMMGGQIKKFEGIQVNTEHPYNEIVVYHRDCSYHPELIISIPCERIGGTINFAVQYTVK